MIPRTKIVWNDKADLLIRENWLKLSMKEMARMLGVSYTTVRNRGLELGLPKPATDPTARSRVLSRVMKQQRGGEKGKGRPIITSSPVLHLQKVMEIESFEAATRRATINLELAICDLADKLGMELLPYNTAG